MLDFAQVYYFLGRVFDLETSGDLQRLTEMHPSDAKTVLLGMKNLSMDLSSPNFEAHSTTTTTMQWIAASACHLPLQMRPPLQQQASSQQFGYSPHEQRSSAGRPPHTLIAFGFGGRLVVMKETSFMTTNFGSGNQGNSQGTVSVLNISEIVADKIGQPSISNGSALSYFNALCRQPIPGPLVGGSASAKDVNKWLDEIIGGYESSVREFQGGDVQKLLISLLKILYQHYGKQEQTYSIVRREQNLLVYGRRKEALRYAQEGQLWGPALILALQLGDKF